MRAILVGALGAVLMACGQVNTYIVADPVLHGKRYRNEPVHLDSVSMIIEVAGPKVRQVEEIFFVGVERPVKERRDWLGVSIGFQSGTGGSQVVRLTGGKVVYGVDKIASVESIHKQVKGRNGCSHTLDGGSPQADWFNDFAVAEAWHCTYVLLRFDGPLPAGPVALILDPVSVDGRVIRLPPIDLELYEKESAVSQ
jgi:hypothetical protein